MYLRPVTADDTEILFYWRDDKETRNNSRHSEPLTLFGHAKWVSKALVNPNIKLLICQYHDGPPAGLVEFYHHKGLEIGWTVAPEHRRAGIAQHMLELALEIDCGPMWAEIKKTNIASVKLAKRLGFVKTARKPYSPDFAIWEYRQ